MTSLEMLREFKVGMDKIDSDSYPEIYPEQIFMFINKAIDELVNEGRKIFEKDQTITDNLKSLIPKEPKILVALRTPNTNRYVFDLNGIDYLFYIASDVLVKVGEKTGIGSVVVTQHDDIKKILDDPFNSPRPSSVPITFSRDSIVGYATNSFELISLSLTYIRRQAKVSKTVNCDIDEQLHYAIVDRAISLAESSLGLNKTQQ